ncbi:condensation domain-containing protein, partial [Dokdonia pacifica]|uniref:condensation domain-containing protein n=1 Tax=Dokdonia pacifica TaxID=1627892 RepID=UPI001888C5D1
GESLEDLLLRLQSLSISGSSHHYLNLSEVQSQSDLGMDLMDHIMVFENYPVQDLIKEEVESKKEEEEGLSLAIASSESYEQTNYDFGVVVNPTSDSLVVKFEYNA